MASKSKVPQSVSAGRAPRQTTTMPPGAGSESAAYGNAFMQEQLGASTDSGGLLSGPDEGGVAAAIPPTGGAPAGEPIAFPHLAAIEKAFGRAVPGEAVVDTAGCGERSAKAYTEGTTVHFATAAPELTVAAHEAAHVLHHAGLAGDQGMGAELHAETVADRVERGESAVELLTPGGPKVSGEIHNYTDLPVGSQGPGSPLEWQSPAHHPLMISDDGNLAVDNEGFGNSQKAWAPASKIAAANTILEAQGARVRLSAGATDLSGKAPVGGAARALSRIVVTMADGSATTELTDDCGTASHEVMGAQDSLVASAQIGDGSGGTTHTDPHRYVGGGGAAEPTAAESYFGEVMAREWPLLSPTDRYARWGALSAADRDTFERKYQIGKYAVPDVGQGITVASLYQTPGWTPQSGAGMTWNFHYATNIATSGADYITLENYADHGPQNWYFWMSGPASQGQSFWDQHESQQGTSSTAFVVTPSHNMIVDVTNLTDTDWWGDSDISVKATTATGGSTTSDEVSLATGASHAYSLALKDFLPQRASEPITIEIIEDDFLTSSTLLTYTWTPPFDRAGSGANASVSSSARMQH